MFIEPVFTITTFYMGLSLQKSPCAINLCFTSNVFRNIVARTFNLGYLMCWLFETYF